MAPRAIPGCALGKEEGVPTRHGAAKSRDETAGYDYALVRTWIISPVICPWASEVHSGCLRTCLTVSASSEMSSLLRTYALKSL
eukprot:IDg18720t1